MPRNVPAILRNPLKSATIMSWTSILARAASLFVVLPLILTRFRVEEIGYWYLLMSLIGLQQVADFGFAPTYARAIAYAIGGSEDVTRPFSARKGQSSQPNETAIASVWATMHSTMGRLALITAPLFALCGALAVAAPIRALEDVIGGWVAFAIVASVFWVTTRMGGYAAYLQGVDEIARLRRWETVAAFGASLCSVAVVALGGSLLELVLMNQSWALLSTARIRALALGVRDGAASRYETQAPDPVLSEFIFANAWRSGIGITMSRGVQVVSGAVVAQFVAPAPLAAYLLALRLLQVVVDTANAPFYSKLPRMAALYAGGDLKTVMSVAQLGMRMSSWVFVLAAGFCGLAAPRLLQLLGSNAEWIGGPLWALMIVGAFAERFGAMHLQLYSTTNHIVWHTLNGITGTALLAIGFALLPLSALAAFPIATLVAYCGFYSWYSARLAARTFDFSLVQFHKTVAIPSTVVLVVLVVLIVLIS